MKILFIAPRFHNNLYFRVKALQDVGHEVSMSVFYLGETECHDTLVPDVLGYTKSGEILKKIVLKFLPKNKRNTYSQILSFFPKGTIRKEIAKKNLDVIILKGFSGLFVLQSVFWARIYNKKIYLLLQLDKHYPETLKKKFQIFLLKKIFRVSGIITPLKNSLEKTSDFFKYIPFIVEVNDFEKTYFKNNRINIISIGKFVERKAHLDLLKAVNSLKGKYSIYLTIIGEMADNFVFQNVKEFIKNNNLEQNVEIKVNIDNSEVLELYKKNDLFVLPSYNEPAAYSILEAMGSKLPVICSDSNGTKCYIEESENGYIFNSRDLDSLQNAIEKIIKDKEILQRMGKKSFEIVNNQFSADVFIEKINKLVLDDKNSKKK